MKKLFAIAVFCSLTLNVNAQDDMYFGKKEMKAEVELPTVKIRDMDLDEYNRYFYNNYIPVTKDSLGNDIVDWKNVGTYPDAASVVDTMKVKKHFIYIDEVWYNPYNYYGWYDPWGWRYAWYNPWYDPWFSPWYDPWWGWGRPWGPYYPYPWRGSVVVHNYPSGTHNHPGSFRPSNYGRNGNAYGNHSGSYTTGGKRNGNYNRNNSTSRNRNNTYSGHSDGFSGGHSGGFSGGGRSGGFSGGGRSGGFSGGGGGFGGRRR